MNPQINPFYSAKCTPEAFEIMMKIREAYKSLNDLLEEIVDLNTQTETKIYAGPKEMSLAKTNLEQSSMWAIKAISHYNVEK